MSKTHAGNKRSRGGRRQKPLYVERSQRTQRSGLARHAGFRTSFPVPGRSALSNSKQCSRPSSDPRVASGRLRPATASGGNTHKKGRLCPLIAPGPREGRSSLVRPVQGRPVNNTENP